MATTPKPEAVLREIGRRVKRSRTLADLTQEEAASAAGIDYKRWQRIEQGRVNMTVSTLVRVASALETTVWTLLSRRKKSG